MLSTRRSVFMAQPDIAESEQAHGWVQTVLRAGLVVAVVAMSGGLGVCLATGRCDSRHVRISELAGPMDPGTRLLTAGILALALTPAARILALVALWARASDWRFVLIGLVVGCVLTASVLVGTR